MRFLLLAFLTLFSSQGKALGPEWLLVSPDGKAEAGQRFELMLVTAGQPFPEEIEVRVRIDVSEVLVKMKGEGPADGPRRIYAGMMPAGATGVVTLQLSGAGSNAIVLQILRH